MGKVKSYGSCRGTDVHHGDAALQFVMTRLVKEVAESDDARGFSGEVHGKCGSTAGEDASHGIQFPAAAAQVVPGYDEVGSIEGEACGKEKGVLTIPESVAGRFRRPRGLNRRERWSGGERGGFY